MTAICKMTGKETELPCSASGCPLFGDCIVEFQKERRKSKPKQTNADRIRAMSDEELVKNFWEVMDDSKFCTGVCNEQRDCDVCRLAWLKQPAEVDNDKKQKDN